MSSKIGVNDLCPCGSKKKYKKCYLSEAEDCLKYLLEVHDKREKYVFSFLSRVWEEISYAFTQKGRIPDRAKLALAFTLIDVLSTYWSKYVYKKDLRQSVIFVDWINSFCLTDENLVFSQNGAFNPNADDIYRLRNSIVHFYGLPREGGFVLMPANYSNKQVQNFGQKLQAKLRKRQICIQSDVFFEMIRSGGELMLNEMRGNIKSKPNFHIEGIERVYDEVQSRGAALIELS